MSFDAKEFAVYIFPALLLIMVVEYFIAKEHYHIKDTLAGFGIAIIAALIAFSTKAYAVSVFIGVSTLTESFRVEYLGYSTLGWQWWVWVLCILGDDFNFYWHHRLSHTIRLLWAAHVPHHSSNNFNFAVSIRNGWFITFYKPLFWIWLAVVGFEPVMIGSALIINATFQYFLHTQTIKSLGWFGKVVNNPWVHQVHHSSNVEYLDKNHGGIFLFWDHVFGTYQDVIKGVDPKYGILKDPQTYNPIILNIHEFRDIFKDVSKASSIKESLMYIFGPPGWSPDRSTLTAKQIQRELKKGA